MNFKNKLFLIKIIDFILIISLLLFSYWYIASQYKAQIQKELRNSIENKQTNLEGLFKISLDTLENNKKTYKDIHQVAIDMYKANPNISLQDLKKQITERYGLLSSDDFDIHLINRDKVVYKSTKENDIGYNLSQFKSVAKTINTAFKTDKIQVSKRLSQDILNFDYTFYSYGRVNNDNVLEISFIDKSTSKLIQPFELDSRPQVSHVSVEYYQIYKDGDKYFYFPNPKKNVNVKKQDMFKQSTYFDKDSFVSSCTNCKSQTGTSQTSTFKDKVAEAFIGSHPIYVENKNDGVLTMYAKLLDSDSTSTEYKNLVIKYQVSMSERDTFLTSLRHMYLWGVFITVLFIYLVHLFINKQLSTRINLITDSIKQGKAVPISAFKNHKDEFHVLATEYNNLINDLNNQINENKVFANTDLLTQVGNRKALNEKFQQLLNDYTSSRKIFSLILFYIDDFKQVNDEYGHVFGDTILKELCDCTLDIIRTRDRLYRTGGGGFVVLLPNTPITVAESIAENLRLEVQIQLKKKCTQEYEQTDSKNDKDYSIKKITISVGVSEVLQGDDYESLFTRLETLLYSAKKDGKNQVKVG